MKREFRDIYVNAGRKKILHGVNLTAENGKMTGIIGPNGCGKSTLLKTTLGIYPMEAGEILLGGASLAGFSYRKLAQLYGYVGQDSDCVFDFTAYEIVSMAAHIRGRANKKSEREIVMDSIEQLEITHLKDRNIQSLSGGERKLVFIARAFAQGVDTIILDEPTNHLDIKHQLFILDILRKSKKTILIVLHDLRLAAHYCDTLYLMEQGKTVCDGLPIKVLQKDRVNRVFGVEGFACKKEDGTLDFHLQMD
jgi:iron complex transport system ATP-binding protein